MKAVPEEFELVRAGGLEEALKLVREGWVPMAGGTELMVQFGAGRLGARRYVDVFGLAELGGIAVGADEVVVGAGVTYAEMRRHEELGRVLPMLVTAAGWTGSVANQNRGTLGGNVVNGSPAADSAPALIAYGAEVELASAEGTRRVAVEDFWTGYKRNVLERGEMVKALLIPVPAARTRGFLRKVGTREAMAISKVALCGACVLAEGVIEQVRIGLASVAAVPFRCRGTERFLVGKRVDAEVVTGAREALAAEIAPMDDIRSSGRYRAAVSGNLLEEFLLGLTG